MRNTGKENQYLKDIPEIRKLNINEQDRSKPRITRILKKTFPPEVEEKIRSLYFNDKKMIRTYPNLKQEKLDGTIVYFKDLLPDIKPYYYKFVAKDFYK